MNDYKQQLYEQPQEEDNPNLKPLYDGLDKLTADLNAAEMGLGITDAERSEPDTADLVRRLSQLGERDEKPVLTNKEGGDE